MFCPNCKYEYKPGIRQCPDCGADLVEELEESKPVVEKEPRWALLCTTQDLVYANFIKETLERNNIPCLTKSEVGVIMFEPGLGYTKIYVPEEKFEESKRIKEQLVDDL